MAVVIRNFVDPKVNEEAKKHLFIYQLRCSIKTESRDQSFETETSGQDRDPEFRDRDPGFQDRDLDFPVLPRPRSRDHITGLK